MVALGVFGGSKAQRVRVEVPEGARAGYVDADGRALDVLSGPAGDARAIVVQDGDTSTRYEIGQGWRLDHDADGNTVLFGTRRVNAFFEIGNLVLVANNASFIAVMAVGMTAVIVLAGIDLSVGSIYGLSAIVGAIALHQLGPGASGFVAVLVALGVCMGVGGLCGLANGVMIVGLRVHPFVITLGMMAALRGITIIIPQKIYGEQSIGGFSPGFTRGFFKGEVLGVQPLPVVVMVLVMVGGWFVLSKMVFGRRVFAIGGSETAARYAGIPVARVKVSVYTIMGLLAGLSGCMYIGYFGAGETNAGDAYELRVVAASVIGGASLMGGRGSAIGAVLGAIIIELINNGMIILGIDQSWNQVVMGGAIILAVVVDQGKRRLGQR